jgi:hypothetical protein
MSDLSPLSGVERTSNFGAATSVFDPERKSSRQIFRSNGSPTVFHVSNMGGYTCRALIFGLSFTNRVVPTVKQGSIS